MKQAERRRGRFFAGEACFSGETAWTAFSTFFETLWLLHGRRRSKRPVRSVVQLKSGVSRETNGHLVGFLAALAAVSGVRRDTGKLNVCGEGTKEEAWGGLS